MTGLRAWKRDAGLPALAGDLDLTPPTEAEVLERVRATLSRPDAPAPVECTWDYARWKPGVSITCAYRLGFEDGEERIVGLKRYGGDKASSLARRPERTDRIDPLCDRLLPRRILTDEGMVVWSFPADRILAGLGQLFDRRRTARLIEDSGALDRRSIRRRRVAPTLLRYKPERRAVFRLDLLVRTADGAAKRRFAARVLEPEAARRTAASRRTMEGAAGGVPAPRLVGADLFAGILVEEWLDARTPAPDAFRHAGEAGRALARLHGVPDPPARPSSGRAPSAELRALFAVSGDLVVAFSALREPGPLRSTTWTHGDFHPDQVAFLLADGEARLLDLDLVGAGDPVSDLASWVADHLLVRPSIGLRGAGAPLLAGYAEGGGVPVDETSLAARVSEELVRRAAAALRRLEEGAVDQARRALELAREVAPGGKVPS